MDKLKELVSDAIQCCYDTNGYEVDFDNGDTENCVLLNDANYALEEALDSYSPWINVEDNLPEFKVRVLAFDKNGFGCVSARLHDYGWYLEGELDKNCNVTHWMPLPESPVK